MSNFLNIFSNISEKQRPIEIVRFELLMEIKDMVDSMEISIGQAVALINIILNNNSQPQPIDVIKFLTDSPKDYAK